MRDVDADFRTVIVTRRGETVDDAGRARGQAHRAREPRLRARGDPAAALPRPRGTRRASSRRRSSASTPTSVSTATPATPSSGSCVPSPRARRTRARSATRRGPRCAPRGSHPPRSSRSPGAARRTTTATSPRCLRSTRRARARWSEALLAMSYDDPSVRNVMDLEGVKRWLPGDKTRLRRPRRRRCASRATWNERPPGRRGHARARRRARDARLARRSRAFRWAGSSRWRRRRAPSPSSFPPGRGRRDTSTWASGSDGDRIRRRASGAAARDACSPTRCPRPATRRRWTRHAAHLRASRGSSRSPRAPIRRRVSCPLGAVAEAGGPAVRVARSTSATGSGRTSSRGSTSAQRVAQWDATTRHPWEAAAGLPAHVEQAVAQVMTYIAQNEYAALYVPSRFLPQVNPSYAEVLLWLASHVHDEARHVEVFTKRALAGGARALRARVDRPVAALAARGERLLAPPRCCSTCSAKARSSTCSASSSGTRPMRPRPLQRASRTGTSGDTSTSASRMSAAGSRSARRSATRLVAAAEARAAKLTSLSGLSPVADGVARRCWRRGRCSPPTWPRPAPRYAG